MSDVKQALASLVECPICLEPFKDPRMLLACLHTICRQCLGDHVKKSGRDGVFQCPLCRKDSEIPAEGVDAFPCNFFVNSCTDLLRDAGAWGASRTSQDHGKGKLCNFCEIQDSRHFCLTCNEYYCEECSQMHRKLKATSGHEQLAVEDLTDDVLMLAASKVEIPRCPKHKKKLKLYCSTCECSVCSACFPVSHQAHTIREIADVDRDAKLELCTAMDALRNMAEIMHTQSQKVDRARTSLSHSSVHARTTTSNVLQEMKRMLERKMAEVDQEIMRVAQEGRAKADFQSENLALNTQQIHSVLTFLDGLQKKGTAFNRLAFLPEVRSLLKQFQTSSQNSAAEATDAAASVPTSTDLIVKYLDGLVVKEEVKIGASGAKAGPTLEILITSGIRQNKVMKQSLETSNPTVKKEATVKPESLKDNFSKPGDGGPMFKMESKTQDRIIIATPLQTSSQSGWTQWKAEAMPTPMPGTSMQEEKKETQDPDEPKRPKTAYFMWLGANKASLKTQFPNIQDRDLRKIAGILWRSYKDGETDLYQGTRLMEQVPHIPEKLLRKIVGQISHSLNDDRKHWEEIAAEEKAKYDCDMDAYKASVGHSDFKRSISDSDNPPETEEYGIPAKIRR